MSARPEMTLYVEVKPGSSLQQLMHLGSGGSSPGGTPNPSSASGGIFKKLSDLGAGQLLKLAGIGVGIGSMVALLVKSSGILQGTLKIMQMSFMLVLKPFGDLLGFALRPLALMMLRFAIPFYKMFAGWTIDQLLGKAFGPLNPGTGGKFLDAQTQNVNKALTGIAINITNAGTQFITQLAAALATLPMQLGVIFKYVPTDIYEAFTALENGFSTLFGGLPKDIFQIFADFANNTIDLLSQAPANILQIFTNLGTNLWSLLQQAPGFIFKVFSDLGNNFIDVLSSIPSTIVGVFSTLAQNITSALSSIPQAIYNAIIGWIKTIPGIGGLVGGGATTTQPRPQGTGGNRAVTQAIAATTAGQS